MKLIRSMIEIIEHLSDICTEKRCLIHGDFGSYNLLTAGGNITAVIDWDLAIFGDPLYEIASLLFWNETHMQGVIDYYSSFIIQHELQQQLLCYQLRFGLNEIFTSATGQVPIHLSWLLNRCRELCINGGYKL